MENGIDLNEIPGEKAARGERIQSNFPKKNRSSPRGNNDFVEVEPIRNVQQFIDRFQKPRVHVPEIRKPPKNYRRDPFIPPFQPDRPGMLERLFTGALVLLFWAIVIAIVGGALYFSAIALDALFTFVSEFTNDIFDFVSSVLAFLWECLKIIFWIYVILIMLSLFD
ncbi:MAG: hypothetical protein ACPHUK_09180 [Candidatus Poseidoniaceae archaeon]